MQKNSQTHSSPLRDESQEDQPPHQIAMTVFQQLEQGRAERWVITESGMTAIHRALSPYFGKPSLVGAIVSLASVLDFLHGEGCHAAVAVIYQILTTAEPELVKVRSSLCQVLSQEKLDRLNQLHRFAGAPRSESTLTAAFSTPGGGVALRQR